MIIKELLNGKKELIVILNSFNRETFLQQAKNEGFMWKSSKEIKGSDNCFFHVFVKDDLTISNQTAKQQPPLAKAVFELFLLFEANIFL